MASSRLISEINQRKSALEKLIPSNGGQLENEERVLDLLNLLLDTTMTVEVLKETNVGQVLQGLKSKFPEAPVGIAAKKVIAKWRKDCKPEAETETPKKPSLLETEGVGEEKPRGMVQLVNSQKKKVDSFRNNKEDNGSERKIQRVKSYDEDEWNEDHYENLSDVRRKVSKFSQEV
jgi:hypothetical protein